MAFTVHTHPEQALIYIRRTGPVLLSDLKAMSDEIARICRADRSYTRLLVDYVEPDHDLSQLTSQDVQLYAGYQMQFADVLSRLKVATVAPQPLLIGFSRMWAAQTQSLNLPLQQAVFTDRAEAEVWLLGAEQER